MKLFLLDAFALIYRAHFAFSKNPRINSKGMSTGCVLGFLNSLIDVIKNQKPTHIAVAFDMSGPTFRHEQFEAYKANRESQPEDITLSVPIIKELLEAFNVTILEKQGYEADDIVGTVALDASKKGYEVYMVTPDKDYGQLVSDKVYLYKPSFMGNGVDIMGPKEICEKWGVPEVHQVIDMLGLQGDAVDNIPGVPGVGPKTASKLLNEYGSIENILENTADLKGKLKERLEENKAQAILSKALATIKLDVPIEYDLEGMVLEAPDTEKVFPIFDELEFRTLKARLFEGKGVFAKGGANSTSYEEAATPSKKKDDSQMNLFGGGATGEGETVSSEWKTLENTEHTYQLAQTDEEINQLTQLLLQQKEFCFDTETTDIDAIEAELVGIAFSWKKGEGYYVPMLDGEEDNKRKIGLLQAAFDAEEIVKVGQNLKYDILVLGNYGLEVKGKLFDTMLAHYLIQPDMRHGMDVLAENYLGYKTKSIEDLIGKKGKNQGNMKDVPLEQVVEYAVEDADITYQLREKLGPELEKNGLMKLFEEIELPLLKVLAVIERNGVKVDTGILSEMSVELAEESTSVEKKIYEIAGESFNIASPKQLGEILFDKLKLVEKPKKTKTGQYATGEEVLTPLAEKHEIIDLILNFREYNKLKSTYVDALPKMISTTDTRIHTSFRQAVAATGRLSSDKPNLQNIPIRTEKGRAIRKAFVAKDDQHTLIAADYSQIELRIMAAFSEDGAMMSAFKEGRDIHATTASKVFGVELEDVSSEQRRKAKSVNFGIIYGTTAFGLSQNLGIPRTEASEIIESYFTEFPSIKNYMDSQVDVAQEKGYVETIMGRRRYLKDINSRNYTLRAHAERNAVNAPIQGSAADMIKVAMININDWMAKEKLRSKMILQVHDELIFDVIQEEKELIKTHIPTFMKDAVELSVPMEIGMGEGANWLEAH
ncbi:MAG: DNA polymerase I [Cyclobacteriaceae bacterium]